MSRTIYLLVMLFSVGIAVIFSAGARETPITQEELVRNTQEIFDAVAPGNPEPFKKYFAEDAMFFDEKGRNMDKAALVKDIQPLPQGYSGSIKIVQPKSHIEDNVAVLSYDLDETEVVFGQKLKARYHETDTWMRRAGKWQIVAGEGGPAFLKHPPGERKKKKNFSFLGNAPRFMWKKNHQLP